MIADDQRLGEADATGKRAGYTQAGLLQHGKLREHWPELHRLPLSGQGPEPGARAAAQDDGQHGHVGGGSGVDRASCQLGAGGWARGATATPRASR